VNENHNQYSRTAGDMSLMNALAEHYSPLVGRQVNPLTEVAVSVGASEALFAVMQSMINEGDEVVVLEPTFDIYTAAIQMAGGVTRSVPLELNRSNGKWELDFSKYEAAITPKTRLLLINTPHNPTGKVFSRSELEQMSTIIKKHTHVTAIMDEVYEKLVYDNNEHIRLASFPGMWDRVLTISSSGKTFSCTGWKMGWCYGAEHLVKPIVLANQWIQYCVSTPTQWAIAKAIKQAEQPYEGYPSYYEYIRQQYIKKRNSLVASLRDANFEPSVPEGGFFVMADTSKHNPPQAYLEQPGLDGKAVTRDWAFAR
jgi:kynurenine--oxoglutarate transaminase/cysteine-S-conjugate beta-lyase/glutamine--phenylpyruvate transaminase